MSKFSSIASLMRIVRRNNSSNEMADLSKFMHGRKNRERRDSVTLEILQERARHQARIDEAHVDADIGRILEKEGLGSKRRKSMVYSELPFHMQTQHKTLTGAGGYSVHLASASREWPIFKHLLPEIAFAGHSNSGKSTLVNAMAGVSPRSGPAGVSERAGWTDQICFYQLGKRPPLFTLADLPGYGHAVASIHDKRAWNLMNRDYLATRPILARCCVLVDCTRGLCDADIGFIRFLHKNGISWQVILTKADLLDCDQLAKSIAIVEHDLRAEVDTLEGREQQTQVEEKEGEGEGEAEGEGGEEVEGGGEKVLGPQTASSIGIPTAASPTTATTTAAATGSQAVKSEASVAGKKKPAKKKTVVLPDRLVLPVSAATGAGIGGMYRNLMDCVKASYTPIDERDQPEVVHANAVMFSESAEQSTRGPPEQQKHAAVREHFRADSMRVKIASRTKK